MTGERSFRILLVPGLLSAAIAVSCTSPSSTATSAPAAAAPAVAQEKGGQDETGPYEVVPDWPKPLTDAPDGVKHDGWTWGSVGAVYAETPDRIWIAQRGELPLPAGARPWTPYALLQPTRGNATGNGDGLNATCGTEEKRGWERRYHHVIMVMNRDGN
ncbi:MAG: hypothetical protein E6H78_19015, partial [Betaproteobacteria bacterium]